LKEHAFKRKSLSSFIWQSFCFNEQRMEQYSKIWNRTFIQTSTKTGTAEVDCFLLILWTIYLHSNSFFLLNDYSNVLGIPQIVSVQLRKFSFLVPTFCISPWTILIKFTILSFSKACPDYYSPPLNLSNQNLWRIQSSGFFWILDVSGNDGKGKNFLRMAFNFCLLVQKISQIWIYLLSICITLIFKGWFFIIERGTPQRTPPRITIEHVCAS
jgi:hypothetical protein